MASADQVRTAALALLPTLDFNTATQNAITRQLEAQLHCDLAIHSALLTEVIEKFLMTWSDPDDPDEDEVPGTQDDKPDTPDAQPAAKRARDAHSEAAVSRAATSASASPSASTSVQLSEKRRATVDMFKGKAYVNVREYYTVDGEDSLKPGKKGLSMLTDQFRALVAGADAVDAAVAAGGQLGVVVSLSDTRRVTVMEHSGVVMVDLREYYLKDGLMAPGKKGISLNTAQWVQLRSALPSLLLAVDKLAPASTPSSTGGPSTPSTATQDTKEGEHTLALSDTRQVTVSISSFTNKPSVDVREFYWAEGATGKELRPGKTGLFLNDLQWPSLVQHANALNDALLAGSEMSVKLGNTLKKASVRIYKGATLFDLREFYVGKGPAAPELAGKKGISLKVAEWKTLHENLKTLNEKFQALVSRQPSPASVHVPAPAQEWTSPNGDAY